MVAMRAGHEWPAYHHQGYPAAATIKIKCVQAMNGLPTITSRYATKKT